MQASAPWTLPSLATLHTGLPVGAHGAGRLASGERSGIAAAAPTLAERLARAGYDTAAIVARNANAGPGFGFERGFALFDYGGDPVARTALPRFSSIQITQQGGDVLMAFNTVPYNSRFREQFGHPSEVILIVIHDGSPSIGYNEEVTLVDNPTASGCTFLADTEGNLFLFWFDERTGKVELFMKYLAQPGISLEIALTDWAWISTIPPNKTKSVRLTLKNTGTVEFDTAIFVEGNASIEWDLDLDTYRAHIKSRETWPINLTVHCPAGARHGECIEVWVNATTSNRDYSSRLRLLVFVQWRRQLEVACRATSVSPPANSPCPAAPGQSCSLSFRKSPLSGQAQHQLANLNHFAPDHFAGMIVGLDEDRTAGPRKPPHLKAVMT